MTYEKTARGFGVVVHPRYTAPHDEIRVVQESSAIDDSSCGMQNPGSSFLWVGEDLHLNRREVKILQNVLRSWLKTGRLRP